VFLMDVRDGLMAVDMDITKVIRSAFKPVIYAVNKVDSERYAQGVSEFYRLGVDEVVPVSAAHGIGIGDLIDRITPLLPEVKGDSEESKGVRVAIVGRPNVGKSSLVNKLLGYDRVVVSEVPGTTTDTIDTPFTYQGKDYVIIDTAGMRRKARVSRRLEEYCVMGAIQSIERCDVALLVIDPVEGVTTQDLKIGNLIYNRGRGVLLVVNKWDLVTDKERGTAEEYERRVRRRFPFLYYAPLIFVSALTGQRVKKILDLTTGVFNQMEKRVPTATLNRVVRQLQEYHKSPPCKGRDVRIKYITQTGTKPPEFTAFVNYPDGMKEAYRRFMTNRMREVFDLGHSPVRIRFRPSRGES
ncbi:MAG: ribosome biogenesis GTPase Der, partial [Thermodesulfobacteriota bacterium]